MDRDPQLQQPVAAAEHCGGERSRLGVRLRRHQQQRNLRSQTITRDGLNWAQAYTYDGVNRLSTSGETGPGTGWSRGFDYDRYGNGWVSSWSVMPPDPYTAMASTNYDGGNHLKIQTMVYDAAGNQTVQGGAGRVYDADGRMESSTINGARTVYGYDADGRRVMKKEPAITTLYVYDAFGQLAAEYETHAQEYTPPTPPCQTCYVAQDHLGSTRMVTDAATGTAKGCHDYLPFGEEIPAGVDGRTGACWAAADTTLKFTAKERDEETGLDYFEARYYSAAQGRYTIPDWSERPEPVPYANLLDPQTLNPYTYGRNNPLSNKDEDGHCTVDGERHNWFWCAAHAAGITQTQAEQAAQIEHQRDWLIQNVATTYDQRVANERAEKSEITQLYGQWNDAVQNAQARAGMESQYPADWFRRAENGNLVLYRGGSLQATLKDVKMDPMTGLLKNTHGISLNVDPSKVSRFGDLQQILSLPPQLRVIQRGKDLGHFEITPRHSGTMDFTQFNQFLQEVVTKLLGPG